MDDVWIISWFNHTAFDANPIWKSPRGRWCPRSSSLLRIISWIFEYFEQQGDCFVILLNVFGSRCAFYVNSDILMNLIPSIVCWARMLYSGLAVGAKLGLHSSRARASSGSNLSMQHVEPKSSDPNETVT